MTSDPAASASGAQTLAHPAAIATAKSPPGLEVAMTRVLVVHHDIDMSDLEVDSLRRRGYQVTQCLGPSGGRCPVLAGYTCDLAAEADVLVYDAWATGEPDGAERLIEGLRDIHPEVPIVLTASGIEPDWIDTVGRHRVTPLVGRPSGDRLAAAIEGALAGNALAG